MIQQAPDPTVLAELVAALVYRPGWRFVLAHIDRGQGSVGLTLDITTLTANSYHPETCDTCQSVVTNYQVHHYMPVPPAAYDRRSWQRWLLDQILLVERHEACEFFQVDGTRPYAPHHGPGNDPYIVFDHGTDTDTRTSFRGDVQAAS